MVSACSPCHPSSPSLPCWGGWLGRAGLWALPACFSLLRSKTQVSSAAVTSSKSVLVCVQNCCLVPPDTNAAVTGPLSGFAFQRSPQWVRCHTSPLLIAFAYSSQQGAPSPSLPAQWVWLCWVSSFLSVLRRCLAVPFPHPASQLCAIQQQGKVTPP